MLETTLNSVLVAAVPVVIAALITALKNWLAYLQAKTNDDLAKRYLSEFDSLVVTAVTKVSQTYVKAMKEQDKFTLENQKEAFQKAKNAVLVALSPSATDFIKSAYSNFDELLGMKIEEAVYDLNHLV